MPAGVVLNKRRHGRLIIHSCLIIEYLPGEGCQPCEAPLRGYGVDHTLQADKMIAKQERIIVHLHASDQRLAEQGFLFDRRKRKN